MRAYAGSCAAEEPRALAQGEVWHEVVEIVARWREPDARYFRVRLDDGRVVLLRYDENRTSWSVTS